MIAEMPSSAKVRVLIAEDQALVRRGTSVLLSMEPDMEVVGQACDGVEAIAMADQLRPDVVLMDLHMPRLGGVAATREITKTLPGTQVLVLTTLNDDETVFEAVRAGAQGYLLKDVTEQELLETIRALRRGESRLTPQIARKVMDQFRRMASASEYASTSETSAKKPGAAHRNAERQRREDSAADHRRHEQPANRCGDVPGGRHRQELCQPHHGEVARQYAHGAGGHFRETASPGMNCGI